MQGRKSRARDQATLSHSGLLMLSRHLLRCILCGVTVMFAVTGGAQVEQTPGTLPDGSTVQVPDNAPHADQGSIPSNPFPADAPYLPPPTDGAAPSGHNAVQPDTGQSPPAAAAEDAPAQPQRPNRSAEQPRG